MTINRHYVVRIYGKRWQTVDIYTNQYFHKYSQGSRTYSEDLFIATNLNIPTNTVILYILYILASYMYFLCYCQLKSSVNASKSTVYVEWSENQSSRFFKHFRQSDRKMYGTKVNQFPIDYKLRYQEFRTMFYFHRKSRLPLFLKMKQYIFYTTFEAFFFNSPRKDIDILNWKNDQFKGYFNFDIVKLVVWKTKKDIAQ